MTLERNDKSEKPKRERTNPTIKLIGDLVQKMEYLEQERMELKDELDDLTERRDRFQKHEANLKDVVEDVGAEIFSLEYPIMAKEAEINTIQKKIDVLRDHFHQLEVNQTIRVTYDDFKEAVDKSIKEKGDIDIDDIVEEMEPIGETHRDFIKRDLEKHAEGWIDRYFKEIEAVMPARPSVTYDNFKEAIVEILKSGNTDIDVDDIVNEVSKKTGYVHSDFIREEVEKKGEEWRNRFFRQDFPEEFKEQEFRIKTE
jgi:chromosome segregation ATPase